MTSTIMLVEDSAITRKMVRSALETHGFSVLDAPDGSAALSSFSRTSVALVLQDLILPDMDGFELLRRLRAMPGGAEVPILAFSGLLSKVDEARVSAVGFDDVISKPVEPSRLVQIVRAHLPSIGAVSQQFGQGKRLIVADDDLVQRKLVMFRLARVGFEVVGAADGAEALEMARESIPDAIVSDVLMPRLDGFGLCLAIRADPRLARLPIVLTTNSYIEAADRELARRAGASELIVRTPELRGVVEALRASLAAPMAPPPTDAIDGGLERERTRRVMAQLERQVAINTGIGQRCALLSAELSVVSGISEALAREHDIEDALREVLAACFDAGGVSFGALYLSNGEERRVIGFEPGEWAAGERDSFFGDPGLLEVALRSRAVIALPSDAIEAARTRTFLQRAGGSSALIVPLAYKEVELGALLMVSTGVELHSDDRILFAQAVANQISQALALARAFTDKVASERAARAQAAVLRSILESMADGVVVTDDAGKLIHFNPAAGEILRRGPTSSRPEQWTADYGLYRADRVTPLPADELPLIRAMRGEAVDQIELFMRHPAAPDGVWLSMNARPLHVEDGEVGGGAAVFRDVTRDKAAHAQLMVSDRMASVGMLAAGVAHEINNPLTAVMANLDLAIRDVADLARMFGATALGDLSDELKEAREGAERVRDIVRDLRIFSRAEEDKRGPVDVRRVLESSLRMAWNEVRHRAQLVTEYGEVPPVDANESRLGQVFLNLIVNAAQAIPPGQADRHQIRVATRVDGAGRVCVDIADSGHGMAPEVLDRLFTPFFTTKPAGVGTGLGLAICQRLIAATGGDIAVRSVVGQGTTFTVALPALEMEAAATAPRRVAQSSAKRRGRLLVIDDEPSIARAIQRALGAEHDIVGVTSAADGLACLDAGEPFDIVFCDLMMPVMTGMDFHAELAHRHPELLGRIVFLTGGAFTPQARAFLDDVPNVRLEKPFDLQNLRAMINDRLA